VVVVLTKIEINIDHLYRRRLGSKHNMLPVVGYVVLAAVGL
jgi:hypothetical protein